MPIGWRPQPTEVYVEPPQIWFEQNPGMKWGLDRLLPGQRATAQEWWKFAVSTLRRMALRCARSMSTLSCP